MKICSACKQSKVESEFFSNARMKNGLSNQCKVCHSISTYKWRVRHKEQAREIDRLNKAKQRKREGSKATNEKWRDWYASNSEHRQGYLQKYRGRNPEKVIAQNAVGHALRTGKLTRPNKCSKCGVSCKPDAHHPNYKQKLRVIWVCKKCHRALQK